MRFKGAEAVAAFEINRQWTVNGAIQWLNAVQVPLFDLTISGKVPENTPKWLGNASVTHRPALLPGLTLTAGVSFAAARPVNPQDQGFIPGYALYTAGANYVTRIGGHRTAFGLSVDNIANKRYWNSVQTGTYGTGMDRGFKMNVQTEF
jgi:iron complex outermembrane receptor protein